MSLHAAAAPAGRGGGKVNGRAVRFPRAAREGAPCGDSLCCARPGGGAGGAGMCCALTVGTTELLMGTAGEMLEWFEEPYLAWQSFDSISSPGGKQYGCTVVIPKWEARC